MAITREDLDAGRVDWADVAGARARAALPTPGEILAKEFLEPFGITPYRLARDIGVPPNRSTAIINGTRAISPETALRLARYFGTSAQSWINLQTRHDLALAQRAHGQEIAQTVRPLAA